MNFKNRPLLSLVVLTFTISSHSIAQSINSATPIRNYYYDYKLSNPAFTGMYAKHSITTAYSGDNSTFGSPQLGYGSYEMNIHSIQSGVGFISSVQEIGIVRFTHYGILFSKKLELNETSGFRVGTQLAYQRERIDYTKLRFSDPFGDPIMPGIEKNGSFNASVGMLYYSSGFTAGASIKNVVKAEEENTELNIIIGNEFKIADGLKATPSVIYITDFDDNAVLVNSSFQIIRWILVGAGYTIRQQSKDNLDLNFGLNILDRVQIIHHVYASEYDRYRTRESNSSWMETMIRVRIGELTGKKSE